MHRRGSDTSWRSLPFIRDPRFAMSFLLVVVLTLIGATGFHYIEGYSYLDALYMTVITLSTVGFGEVAPLSPAGKLFTMLLIVWGFRRKAQN